MIRSATAPDTIVAAVAANIAWKMNPPWYVYPSLYAGVSPAAHDSDQVGELVRGTIARMLDLGQEIRFFKIQLNSL